MSPPSPQSDIILKIYTNILYSTLPGTITHLFKLIKRISFSYRQKKKKNLKCTNFQPKGFPYVIIKESWKYASRKSDAMPRKIPTFWRKRMHTADFQLPSAAFPATSFISGTCRKKKFL